LTAAATWYGEDVEAKEGDPGALEQFDDVIHGSQPAREPRHAVFLYH